MLISHHMHESTAEKCGNMRVDRLDMSVGDLRPTTRLLVEQAREKIVIVASRQLESPRALVDL